MTDTQVPEATPARSLSDMAYSISQLRLLGAAIVGVANLSGDVSFEGQRDTIYKMQEIMDIHASNLGMSIDWEGYHMSQEMPDHYSRKAREFLSSNEAAFAVICTMAQQSV